MLYKKCLLLLLFLSVYSGVVCGQELNKPLTEYLRFDAPGLPGNEIKIAVNREVVNVKAIGGFFKIHKTSALDVGIYLRQYNPRKHSVDIDSSSAYKDVLTGDTEIYLLPDSEICFDVIEQGTNKLLRKYIVKRPKAIPQLNFFDQSKGIKSIFYVFNNDSETDKIDVSPGMRVAIAAIERKDFRDLEMEYTLTNLKTHKSSRGTIKQGMSSLKLTENSDYQLSINYSLQKESVGTVFITVKPYWYNSIFFYISICGALIVLILFFLNNRLKRNLNRSEKKQHELEEAAIKLQSLLNPHFTFNALSSIQGLMNSGKIDDANQYLYEFSSLLRKSLSKSQLVFHSLDQELEMMQIYIRLEALRFNFNWDIKVEDSLHTSEIEIPTMLLQPLIENAIRHGLSGIGEIKHLAITCGYGAGKDSIVIVIKDNGKGIKPNNELGYGLSLTQKRIEAINKLSSVGKIKLGFEIQSGTQVTLTFFNWLSI
ncbi:sensor histidine kinase [Chitinophaga sancti]|uniref:Histidine kinase n=1 Tax=Chitinophaga sancti TaxID=1004 RepID=A0A1K1SCX7_9BACT|nr:histidine kinase [Chitinophaga sancti]WQD63590.1 histidine kinase [Chitinophaga sancti]WQG90784.1 histidine kinase [Chitinophaga sancti]SFW81903.1 Histidine kinase [Chitinophaga sancti]